MIVRGKIRVDELVQSTGHVGSPTKLRYRGDTVVDENNQEVKALSLTELLKTEGSKESK